MIFAELKEGDTDWTRSDLLVIVSHDVETQFNERIYALGSERSEGWTAVSGAGEDGEQTNAYLNV